MPSAAYMREYRKRPDVKAKSDEYNRMAHQRRWSAMSASERRASHYKKRYGITLEDAVAKVIEQKFACPCCEEYLEVDWAVVDHNHETDQVRGMLCNSCNKALGFAYENKETLQNMVKYLETWGG